MKKRTPAQLQVLENFYLKEMYPKQGELEDLSAVLGLTFNQVRGWFVEKRRRDKKHNEMILPSCSVLNREVRTSSGRAVRGKNTSRSSEYNDRAPAVSNILTKVYHKDGPPLLNTNSMKSQPTCLENQTATKRRKVSKVSVLESQDSNKTSASVTKHGIGKGLMTIFQDGDNSSAPMKKHGLGKGLMTVWQDVHKKSATMKKHGIGKGLMTVWRITNPGARDLPSGIDCATQQFPRKSKRLSSMPRESPQKKRSWQQILNAKQRSLGKNLRGKRKPSTRRREVESDNAQNLKQPSQRKCELAMEGELSATDHFGQFSMLVDDEELELRELQAGANPLTCSNHISTNGFRGCSLCKDLLVKFPPNSIKMKLPLSMKPWDSSPETIKKLFKVFHFLYTYAVMLDTCTFTLDEFAQAFHDKDSLLLGKVHVALLKLLLSDVETELGSGALPHLGLSCKFLALIHSVENQEYMVEFWKQSLNPLTWTEILHEILVSAGFGSKQGVSQRGVVSKETDRIIKYGLRPGTLKDELFKLLLEKGKNGFKVSELAKALELAEQNFASTSEKLELLISSTLSSDITLFEKISSSAYRLRNSISEETNDYHSDTDSGSVDDSDDGAYCSSDNSVCNSRNSSLKKVEVVKSCRHNKNNARQVCIEIDESYPGEVWLLGLVEGEYSDLSTEEKLNALVALIDLLSAGSSIRMEDPTKTVVASIPNIYRGSGAKIKRSSVQHNLPRRSWDHPGQMHGVKESYTVECRPIDSSVSISKKIGKEKFSCRGKGFKKTDDASDLHPMQSLFLGSDRRYNRYWLFLGPCNPHDPGHRRIYFESSEDGHWEVIDTEEALCALLSVLDDRGAREAALIESLEKREAFLRQEMSPRIIRDTGSKLLTQSDQLQLEAVREESSSPVSDVDNNLSLTGVGEDSMSHSGAIVLEVGDKEEQQTQKWNRMQAFDVWIWNSFYLDLNVVKHYKRSYLDSFTRCASCHDLYWKDERHCRTCHITFELDIDLEERYAIHAATCRPHEDSDIFPKYKVLPPQLQALKAATLAIESVMPEDALVGAWRKSGHRLWVKRLRRTSSLPELVQVIADFVSAINVDWWPQCSSSPGYVVLEEVIACFPYLQHTSSAVALWLVKLDALLAPFLERIHIEKIQEVSTRRKDKRVCKQ